MTNTDNKYLEGLVGRFKKVRAEREELLRLRAEVADVRDQAARLIRDLDAAVRERDRLRAALREIAEGATSTYEDGWCGDIAIAALKEGS